MRHRCAIAESAAGSCGRSNLLVCTRKMFHCVQPLPVLRDESREHVTAELAARGTRIRRRRRLVHRGFAQEIDIAFATNLLCQILGRPPK
jgi:hypothetical protein